MLRGTHVVIRAQSKDDLDLLHRWLSDLELYDSAWPPYWEFPLSRDRLAHILEEEAKQKDRRNYIIEAPEGHPIGCIFLLHLNWPSAHAELGIIIGDREALGKGYGSDAIRTLLKFAFETLHLHRIYLRCGAGNERAIRTYEACGFRREGIFREACWRDGRWEDELVFSILADEYREAQPA